MNKILSLYDEKYVLDYLKKKVLPLYPNFKKIEKLKIVDHKKNVWEHTYHVVIEFQTTFLDQTGKKHKLPIFCSAHSDEPRKNVYTSLKYLWSKGFEKGNLSIPHPLFYSNTFRATFYRGVEGKHLYHYLKEHDKQTVEEIIPQAAKWFAKLHAIKTSDSKNFNKINSRIKTVMPGVPHILDRIKRDYPEYLSLYQKAYEMFVANEQIFFKSNEERWPTHGDAHPENIIRMSKRKTAVIDFTDLCLADFTRDLGTFVQQLEFMANRKGHDQDYIEKICNLFLDSYFASSKNVLDEDVKMRINTYYNWTAIRTATHFLLKDYREPDRAVPLIENIKKNLNI